MTVAAALDREILDNYNLVIEVVDSGGTALTTTTTLTITVTGIVHLDLPFTLNKAAVTCQILHFFIFYMVF